MSITALLLIRLCAGTRLLFWLPSLQLSNCTSVHGFSLMALSSGSGMAISWSSSSCASASKCETINWPEWIVSRSLVRWPARCVWLTPKLDDGGGDGLFEPVNQLSRSSCWCDILFAMIRMQFVAAVCLANCLICNWLLALVFRFQSCVGFFSLLYFKQRVSLAYTGINHTLVKYAINRNSLKCTGSVLFQMLNEIFNDANILDISHGLFAHQILVLSPCCLAASLFYFIYFSLFSFANHVTMLCVPFIHFSRKKKIRLIITILFIEI